MHFSLKEPQRADNWTRPQKTSYAGLTLLWWWEALKETYGKGFVKASMQSIQSCDLRVWSKHRDEMCKRNEADKTGARFWKGAREYDVWHPSLCPRMKAMLAALYGKGEKPSSSAPQKSLDLGDTNRKQSKQILCKRGFATILWPKLGSEFDTQRPTRCLIFWCVDP